MLRNIILQFLYQPLRRTAGRTAAFHTSEFCKDFHKSSPQLPLVFFCPVFRLFFKLPVFRRLSPGFFCPLCVFIHLFCVKYCKIQFLHSYLLYFTSKVYQILQMFLFHLEQCNLLVKRPAVIEIRAIQDILNFFQ